MGEIELYHGEPRSTKTLRMVTQAVLEHYGEGRKIMGNIHFKHLPYTFVRVTDLIKMIENTVDGESYSLYLDEIQTEVDGRDFFSPKNKKFSHFIAECGKRDIKIRYESKFGSGAELRLRSITDMEIECRAIRDPANPDKKTNLLMGVYTVTKKKPFKRFTYPLTADILSFFYKFYDTRELFANRNEGGNNTAQSNQDKLRDIYSQLRQLETEV